MIFFTRAALVNRGRIFAVNAGMANGRLIGIGVDILHLPRVLQAVERRGLNRWIQKILTPAEARELESGKKDPIVYLATRISAKEAIYKALWPHWRTTWKSVSILNVDSKPTVFDEEGGIGGKSEFDCQISISHDAEFVIAFAVATQSVN